MEQTSSEIAVYILKDLRQELEPSEAEALRAWVEASEENKALYLELTQPESLQQSFGLFYQSNISILAKVQKEIRRPKLMHLWIRWVAAASIVVGLALGGFWFLNEKTHPSQIISKSGPIVTDIPSPTRNEAVITLASGKKVLLSTLHKGELAKEGDVRLVKLENGAILYQNGHGTTLKEMVYNTLTNPNGSHVASVTLSDGTRVWLNSGSSITYPVAFVGSERNVIVTGEAYLEVSHDEAKPFWVRTGSVNVQVLGTHFNVNGYNDEPTINVTLLEGSLRVIKGENQQLLKAGEQVQIKEEISMDRRPDLEKVMAWKNGRFVFGQKANIETIMRQISRWYDVTVEYKGKIQSHFGGSISRNVNVSRVLEMLEETEGVHFKMDGKKILVYP